VGWELKDLVLLQIGLELALLIVMAVLLWRSRRRPEPEPEGLAMPDGLQASLDHFLAESDRLAQTFQETLDDKRRLTKELVDKLDRRLAAYKDILAAADEAAAAAESRLSALGGQIDKAARLGAGEAKANPAAPEVRALVLQLAKRGLSVEDIAVKANLHRGEVELIIDLDQSAAEEI
jgi:hypothetical protein